MINGLPAISPAAVAVARGYYMDLRRHSIEPSHARAAIRHLIGVGWDAGVKWAGRGSNPRTFDYESSALTTELPAP